MHRSISKPRTGTIVMCLNSHHVWQHLNVTVMLLDTPDARRLVLLLLSLSFSYYLLLARIIIIIMEFSNGRQMVTTNINNRSGFPDKPHSPSQSQIFLSCCKLASVPAQWRETETLQWNNVPKDSCCHLYLPWLDCFINSRARRGAIVIMFKSEPGACIASLWL
jgi:hypothetical protein